MKNGKNEYELIYQGKEPEDKILSLENLPDIRKTRAFGEGDAPNKLFFGDNLSVLKVLIKMKNEGRLKNADNSDGIKLIYIDPPFSTNLEFKGKKNQKAYHDKIVGAEFIEFLRKRLILMRGLLSDDGSIYVHLDWKKAHYVKAIMDEVFGEDNFLNDIIWHYGGRGAKAIAGQFSRNHDIILWYKKGERHIFNQLSFGKKIKKGEPGYMMDEDGKWFKTSPRGDYTDESIAMLSKENRIYRTRTGTIRIKYFLKEDGDYIIEDKLVGDVWDDIPDAMHLPFAEKTDYPTQKPEALLARIIRASSTSGDIVLDAFAGAGTTLLASEKLGRKWIGIDFGRLSIHTIERRLLKISESKDLEEIKKTYSRQCSPFEVYTAKQPENTEPVFEYDFYFNAVGSEFILKIEKPEMLSSVMLDYNPTEDFFRIDEFHTLEDLKENNFELRISAEKITEKIRIIISDIFGNEKVFEKSVEELKEGLIKT
ncbi:MAG: site-specific DNA-methyltransferase [Deltaproteobacteria bacterium]|nr:site-specific DNA-methyltransferase [Deltaproteobacteria bacterium]